MSNSETTDIHVEYPASPDLHLELNLGACRIRIAPGAVEAWVAGTYEHPIGTLAPVINIDGGHVAISQEFHLSHVEGIFKTTPRFDLQLGAAMPYKLSLQGGGSEGEFTLGGLPLTHLAVKKGAGDFTFNFSEPNPQPMSLLEVDAGAAHLKFNDLANANFSEMRVAGGVGSFEFDFGGTLQRDASVKMTTGVSSVKIVIPSSTAAKVVSAGVLSSVDVGDGYMKKDGAYLTEAALAGKTPLLTINAEISVGALSIRTR